MRKFIFLLTAIPLILISLQSQGQIFKKLGDKVKRQVDNRIDRKVDNAIDKTLDKAEDATKGTKNGNNNDQEDNGDKKKDKKKKSIPDNTINEDVSENDNIKSESPQSLATYSKFDFVSGDKLIASEDFLQDAIGDFPAKWNTNGSGEIVTTNKSKDRFLMTKKEVVLYPEWVKNLPDNFTLEFDLMSTDIFSFYSGHFLVGATTSKSIGKDFSQFGRFDKGKADGLSGFEFGVHPENAGGKQGMTSFLSTSNNQTIIQNNNDQNKLVVPGKTLVHVSIWRQRNRVRVYLDDKKIWDIPKALPDNTAMNTIYFRNDGSNNENDAFYMGNLRIAVGDPDTRNKLVTEGKFVTHGILFNSGSDVIKPTSYGALKDIANVLNENNSLNVKIVGHTDSDGDDKANLELSKRRANAVKNTLSKEFGISIDRLDTEGKGESEPIDSNATPAGKANNRRVEFIKI